MGHRALVAVERRPDEFDCYRSQWGGRTALDVDPAHVVDEAVAAGRPFAAGASVSRVLDLLDPRSDEALLVRSPGETARYLVRWLGVPAADVDGDGPVVLVPVDDPAAAERLDRTIQTAKGILGDAVDARLVPRWLAVGYLAALVDRHPDAPAGTVWLAPGDLAGATDGGGRDGPGGET